MTLLLVGLNHKTTPVELRERLYLRPEILHDVLHQLHTNSKAIDELSIISTCNRFEVYAATRETVNAQQDILDFMTEYYNLDEDYLLPHLYIRKDQNVIHHIMAVSAGLDSMVLGEAQILGQVSDALDYATSAKSTGTHLHRLFEAAIHTGKRARTETSISQHTTSISHAAAILMQQQSSKVDPKVIILGSGDMAELAVYAIHKLGLSHIGVINRTFSKAQTLAETFGTRAYEWSRLWEQLQDADVVITATSAPHTLLRSDDMKLVMQRRTIDTDLMLIDIALPRDIDPEVGDIDGINLYDIDSLQNIVDASLAKREACIPQVRMIIQQEAQRYQKWLNERAVVPVIVDLRREIANVVDTELQDALNKLPEMSDEEAKIVKRMAHRIMNKVLHAPTVNLRSHAGATDTESYAQIVRELFSLDDSEQDGCPIN